MKVGLFGYDMTALDVVEMAECADRLGFDTLWLGEHLILPVDYKSQHPMTGLDLANHKDSPVVSHQTSLVDTMLVLASIARSTSQLRLATGIFLLTLRHPLLTARAAATLQSLAHGRFSLGIGMGWLAEEFDAVGLSFRTRVSRFEESIDVLRAAWQGGPFAHHGKHFSFESLQVLTEPTSIPLVMAGNSDPAMNRAARLADAWLSSGASTLEDCVDMRDRLDQQRSEVGRQRALPAYFRVARCDRQELDRFAAAGIDNVVFSSSDVWVGSTLAERQENLRQYAASLGLVQNAA